MFHVCLWLEQEKRSFLKTLTYDCRAISRFFATDVQRLKERHGKVQCGRMETVTGIKKQKMKRMRDRKVEGSEKGRERVWQYHRKQWEIKGGEKRWDLCGWTERRRKERRREREHVR